MTCPFWKEVVMVYCDATPSKKMVPANRVVPSGPCECQFEHCPVFEEVQERARRAAAQATESPPLPGAKERTPQR